MRKQTLVALVGAVALLVVNASGAAALQQKLTVPGSQLFGFSVAVDQDTLVVGDPADANGTGALYVYLRAGNNWVKPPS